MPTFFKPGGRMLAGGDISPVLMFWAYAVMDSPAPTTASSTGLLHFLMRDTTFSLSLLLCLKVVAMNFLHYGRRAPRPHKSYW